MTSVTNLYLKELKNVGSTNEETLQLITLARAGDEKAKEQVIKNYLLLVVKIARKYMNMGVPLGDLISEGNIGLMNAALEKFDPSRGAPFSVCAKQWIKQSIIRNCMHGRRIVRLPENISELMRTNRWEGLQYNEISIDAPNEEGDSLADKIPDNIIDNYQMNEENTVLKQKVDKILSFLKGRDAEIVKSCYGIDIDEPMDIGEAAEKFGLTTTRVNQILRNSLAMMKISHDSLPSSKIKNVEIVSARYGADDNFIDVTDKFESMYLKKENIKTCNKLGGDPCPGVAKKLIVQYIYNGELMNKTFSEGTFVKF